MTRYIILIAMAAFLYSNCHAQNMQETLKKTFIAFDTTQDFDKKLEQSNKLSMIAKSGMIAGKLITIMHKVKRLYLIWKKMRRSAMPL